MPIYEINIKFSPLNNLLYANDDKDCSIFVLHFENNFFGKNVNAQSTNTIFRTFMKNSFK